MNTVNELMKKLASELTNDDIDEIIKYQRKQLAIYDSGGKPKREADTEVSGHAQLAIAKLIESRTKVKPQPVKKMMRRM